MVVSPDRVKELTPLHVAINWQLLIHSLLPLLNSLCNKSDSFRTSSFYVCCETSVKLPFLYMWQQTLASDHFVKIRWQVSSGLFFFLQGRQRLKAGHSQWWHHSFETKCPWKTILLSKSKLGNGISQNPPASWAMTCTKALQCFFRIL